MLNLRKIAGIIAIIAVVGFVFLSCEEDSGGSSDKLSFPKELQGVWEGDEDNGTLTITADSIEGDTGNASYLASELNMLALMASGGAASVVPGYDYKITFTIKSGKITVKQKITYMGQSYDEDVTLTYEIKDGVLTIKDEDGDVAFTGKKK